MQLKIFTIPIIGGDAELEEMNKFLRGNKILSVTESAVVSAGGHWWSYSVRYLGPLPNASEKLTKVDYRAILDEKTFAYFAELRTRRKALANAEGVPAYVIFTDAELAEIAKQGHEADLATLQSVKGIGQQKIARYGKQILKAVGNETNG